MHGLMQSATYVHYQSVHSTEHAQVTCQPNSGNVFLPFRLSSASLWPICAALTYSIEAQTLPLA